MWVGVIFKNLVVYIYFKEECLKKNNVETRYAVY